MEKWHFYTSLNEAETAALKLNLEMGVPVAMPEEVLKKGVKIHCLPTGWAIAQTPMSVRILGEGKLQEVEVPELLPKEVEIKKDHKKLIVAIAFGLLALGLMIFRGLK